MARERSFEARRLDVPAFADAGASLAGETALRDLARLTDSLMPMPGDGGAAAQPVRWSAAGQLRLPNAVAPQPWLHLQAGARVPLQCQRCLQPLIEPLAVDRWFRFVADEDEAARLDDEVDEDVLVVSRSFDLQALLEDELILALPIVPRHAVCPEPLAVLADDASADAAHPFAALAALRREGEPG